MEAAKWYRKAAEQGYAEAQFYLGLCYYYGNGVIQDKAEAIKWYLKAADQGDVKACGNLADCYAKGEGVPQDKAESVKWYRKIAEHGDAGIQCCMGLYYANGDGVPQDKVEAAKWYRKAAEQGNVWGQFSLGMCYYNGEGVPQDLVEAVKWYRKAADQGDAGGQFNLAVCYNKGHGVVEDKAEAAKWFRKAADQGFAEAQGTLGAFYSLGIGVAVDKAEAAKWSLKAAEHGDKTGQYLLGLFYESGSGVIEDYVEAYKWFLLAGVSGHELAGIERAKLAPKMTPEQIAEAQRQSKVFLEEKQENKKDAEQSKRKTFTDCKSCGTGYFITSDGYILTAYHVVSAASRVEVRTKSGNLKAKIIHADPANDIAVLKVVGRFSAIPIEKSKIVKLGDVVITIGFPNAQIQGISPKLTKGEISSLFGIRDDPRNFQISAPVQPGNSGGPLLNASGNVIGTLSARLSDSKTFGQTGMLPQNVNYAVKSSYALAMIEAMPEISDKLPIPNQGARNTEEIVRAVENAIVMILVY